MNVFDLVTLDEERTKRERQIATNQAYGNAMLHLGQAIIDERDPKTAKLEAEQIATADIAHYTWYEVDPADLYPAMVDYIQQQLAGEEPGDGIIRSQYYPAAQGLPEIAWQLALLPRDKVEKQEHVELRATALETCRLWFTELLHRACRWQVAGMNKPELATSEPPADFVAPVGLHILKDERFRL